MPLNDETLTMDPRRSLTIDGKTLRVIMKTDSRLKAMVSFQCFSSM